MIDNASNRRIETDIVVIGSGWSGVIAANLAAAKGYQVTIFERGPLTPCLADRGIRSALSDYRNSFRLTNLTRAKPSSAGTSFIGAGGGSNVWGGWCLRPRHSDFVLRQIFDDLGYSKVLDEMGYSVTDWPFGYDEFLPYLEEVEELFGLGNDAASAHEMLKNIEWADQPIFGEHKNKYKNYRRKNNTKGKSKYCNHQAILEILDPNNSLSYSPMPVPNVRLKRSIEYLKSSPYIDNINIVENTSAIKFRYNRNLEMAESLQVISHFNDRPPLHRTVRASKYFLASGAIESARILLSSPGWRDYVALGNQSGQLGKNLTTHIFDIWAKIAIPKSVHEDICNLSPKESGWFASYGPYWLKDTSNVWIKGGSMAILNPYNTGIVNRTQDNTREHNRDETQYLEWLGIGDDLPSCRAYVDLDTNNIDEQGYRLARVTRSFGPLEKQSSFAFSKHLLGEINKLEWSPDSIQVSRGNASKFGDHSFGTCRMGRELTSSVTDIHGRLHEALNIVVVDASTFPSGLGVNPALSVIANAVRITRRIFA